MAERARISTPIVRSGVLAQEFCATRAAAEVAAVYERSLYLRADDVFVCIGEPVVGNGPSTLIVDCRLSELGLRPRVSATIADQKIAIGSTTFTLDRCTRWVPPAWPAVPSPDRLTATCAALVRRLAVGAPQHSPLVSKRIARFEAWLSAPRSTMEDVHCIVGLGPGLTPSGDDVMIGALAMLDALNERDAHASLAHAINAIAPGQTSPLSHCFLRAAAAGHISERFHTIVSCVITGDVDHAIATARTIGHSSGWDMLTGAVIAARVRHARHAGPGVAAPGTGRARSAARHSPKSRSARTA
jgi:uncharacterized protein DUF2877